MRRHVIGQPRRPFRHHQVTEERGLVFDPRAGRVARQRLQDFRPDQRRILVAPDGDRRPRIGREDPRHHVRPAQVEDVEPLGEGRVIRLAALDHLLAVEDRRQKARRVADRQVELAVDLRKDLGEGLRPRTRRRIELALIHRPGQEGQEIVPGEHQPLGAVLLHDLLQHQGLGLDRGGLALQGDGRVAQQVAIARRAGDHDALLAQGPAVLQKAAQQPFLVGAMCAKVIDDPHGCLAARSFGPNIRAFLDRGTSFR